MADALRFLLLPTFCLAGWSASRYYGEATRRATRLLFTLLGLALAVIAIAGCVHSHPALAYVHRWGGHLFFIAVWTLLPWSTGVMLQRHPPSRPVKPLAAVLGLLVLTAASYSATLTGYLNPPDDHFFYEENRNRFVVLHLFFLPAVIGTLLLSFIWAFGPKTPNCESSTQPERSTQ